MPKYKLVYFNGRGRAEVSRQIFALAGEDYEDYRMKEGEWPTLKPNTPFGQAPYMEIEGEGTLCSSLAIARYLARKFGLAGKTDIEQARVDMVADCVEDAVRPLLAVFGAKNDEEKAAIKKKFQEEQFPGNLEKFEKMLTGSKSGYFVGNEITWCDLHFVITVGAAEGLGIETNLSKYPNIAALQKKVESNEKIAAWLAKRPQSNF